MDGKTLLVLGATGLMGQRICAQAERLLPDVRLLRASRQFTESDSRRRIDIHREASLRVGLREVDAVINAVGPYEYDPTPLLAACQRAGAHYIDIAERPEFILAVAAACEREQITVAVASGCSTVPGLIQALVQRWRGDDRLARLRALLTMGTSNAVTPTLIYSLLRPLGRPGPTGERYFGRTTERRLTGWGLRRYGYYPSLFEHEGFGLDEWAVPLEFFAGFDRTVYVEAMRSMAPRLARMSDAGLLRLCRLLAPLARLARPLGTRMGSLLLEAIDERGEVWEQIEVRAEYEGLTVPALPSVWAAGRLLATNDPPSGPVSLNQLLTPQEVVDGLREAGHFVIFYRPGEE